ncbi:DUF1707 SHOCT-like domain-containing protein [Nocardia sp. NPDC003693]
MSESPHTRVGVADRERAMAELAAHFGNGTLTIAEFDERCARAARASTRPQLAELFTDLPAAPPRPPELIAVTGARSAVRIGAVAVAAVTPALVLDSPPRSLLLGTALLLAMALLLAVAARRRLGRQP